jgi:hypothetical protein
MDQQILRVGEKLLFSKNAPRGQYGSFFEDDGETGYFYALNVAVKDGVILDAVHICNVANVVDRDRPSTLSIVWSEDGSKCALLINDYPHAAFDFKKKQGYCRTNFPNFPECKKGEWWKSDHAWSDHAVAWLREPAEPTVP